MTEQQRVAIQVEGILAIAWKMWAPPPDITLSQWADSERRLSSESSASPGQYRTERTAYAREIMDCFSDPDVKEVVFMSSSQVAKTTILENVVGKHIHHDPAPILVIMPTLQMAEDFAKDRIVPMFRDTPALSGLVAGRGIKKSNSTILHKTFVGGHLTIAGANSPSSLASRPIRILLFDEADRYPGSAGTEGDPINLALKRITAFWNAKVGYFSTPGTRGASRIAELYAASDQRKYFVPCPACEILHTLDWPNLRWSEGPQGVHEDGRPIRKAVEAWFECPNCQHKINDAERNEAVRNGKWIAGQPLDPIVKRAGFFIWQGYSPFRTALETANEWLAALGRPEQERTVINTVRGETYQERGDQLDWERIKARSVGSFKRGTAPMRALFITAGADVQKDRIEVSIWGWGRGKDRFAIDHHVLDGDTARPEVWRKLDQLLLTMIPHESGSLLPIWILAIDSQHETDRVHDFARLWGATRVIAIRGDNGNSASQAIIWQSSAQDYKTNGKIHRRAFRPYNIAVSRLKAELYGLLRQPIPEDGEYPQPWVYFAEGFEDEFFRQLCGERLVTRISKGFRTTAWEKARERNEALDCANYARGATEHAPIGLSRQLANERWWRDIEQSLYAAPMPAATETPRTETREEVLPAEQEPERGDGRKSSVNPFTGKQRWL